MKVIFLGSSSFAIPTLNKLVSEKIDIPLVITMPDKPAGRGMKICSTPVKEIAEKKELKVECSLPNVAELKKYSPDYLVVVSYGKFIPEDIVNEFVCINIHPSLLPKYRGPSPLQSALLNGDTETGVTTMLISMEMDAGDILLQEKTNIDINEDYASLEKHLAEIGANLLLKTLKSDIQKIRQKQNEAQATYCKKIQKEDGLINWNKTPLEIHNQVRAIPSFTEVNKKRIKILKTKFIDNKLEILEVQPEGKKPMSFLEFTRGYQEEAKMLRSLEA